jgi:hypothetical protein
MIYSIALLKLISNVYVKLYADIHNHGDSTGQSGKYESFHMRKGNESLLKINRIGYLNFFLPFVQVKLIILELISLNHGF